MQYKIPQNIGIEDKIVGPFSLRQLIILSIGVGISYVIFAISARVYELNTLEYFVISLPALFALALALIKINGIPFGKYIILTLEFAIKPKKRLWDHRGILNIVDPNLLDTPSNIPKKDEQLKAALLKERNQAEKPINLKELSRILDSGGVNQSSDIKHEDMDRAKDDDLITEAFFGHKKAESKTENMYWRTKDSQKKRLEILAKIPTPISKPAVKTPAIAATSPSTLNPTPSASTKSFPPTISPPPLPASTITTIAPPPPPAAPTSSTPVPTPPTTPITPSIQRTLPQKPTSSQKMPTTTPKPMTTPVTGQATPTVGEQKKKRKKKKKPKIEQSARPMTQVDTTQKNKPAQFVPKQEQSPIPIKNPSPRNEERKPTISKAGEFNLEELQKGEIELNLD